MKQSTHSARSVRRLLMVGAAAGAVVLTSAPTMAQEIEEIVVTGSRIVRPNATSTSPVYSVGAAEIAQQQQPEVEKILRVLPITIPGDGQNVNNGTAGVSTVDLRGLGAQRNLVMIDGKRLTPYNQLGQVDVSQIPTALIERVDILTGGASAVYGSDAISGALNFIMKRDFEGVEANYDYSLTGKGDGDIHSGDVTVGANLDGGRGNVVLSVNYSKREGVLFGARPLGRLGIVTEDGSGYAQYLAGQAPTAPPAGCDGPGAVAAGGSTTTLPTRLAIVGGPGLGQFRNDGTLGANCSVFNFNPFNYYQTPLERYGATALAHYEINDHVEVYGRFIYSSTNVTQQIAPSGVFGNTFWVPLANPFINAAARTTILNTANAGRTAATPTVNATNWRDLNNNGVVDAADQLNLSIRRRTVEFGPRSTSYDNNAFQAMFGLRGDIDDNWSYDVSFQRGETDRANLSAGYTNVANIANALNTTSTTTCTGVADTTCVPLNLFGGFGSITPNMVGYSSANALEKQNYRQTIASGVITGSIEGLQFPWADEAVGVSLGTEYREEKAETVPDECLKLAPASCLGGAGGNTLPVKGKYDVKEFFGELLLPVVSDAEFAKAFDIEAAYRYSDYDPSGVNKTWKLGANWAVNDQIMFRGSQQRAARAPNVNELAAPQRTNLANANLDPCSIDNAKARPGANRDAQLVARCIATGMTAAQVGTVENVVAGQINVFSGVNPAAQPTPEKADTSTIGMVLTPDFGSTVKNAIFSVDYYRIDIDNVIGVFGAQEIMDACYTGNVAAECAKIRRVAGTLTLPGSGVEQLTTNLKYLRASGIEFGAAFGIDLEDMGLGADMGTVNIAYNANWYLESESQSATYTPVLDCVGRYGTQCPGGGGQGNPTPEFRFVQRANWSIDDFVLGYTWRYIGKTEIEEGQKDVTDTTAGTFDKFEKIRAFSYIDLNASWQVFESLRISANALNVFNEKPPVVGNEAGQTSANSGNTFPSLYDTLGRVFSVGLNVKF